MVGVPGRSKGCATCRRRKIRCDLQEPACRRCTQSGRECEGYARYPVFINRTQAGPQKRRGLEEAKIPAGPAPAPQDLSMVSTFSFLRNASEMYASSISHGLLLQPDATPMTDQQIVSAFWEKYIPINAYAQGESPCLWLEQVMWMPNKSQILRLSLKALAMTRLGWIHNDQSLILQGNTWYIRALQSVQVALWRENAAENDDLFVAGYILAVHELFESTTSSIAGWNSHILGLSQLVKARGSYRHRSPIARATLEELRTATMIHSVLYRTSSFLGSEEWQHVPWEDTPKDVYQKLYDKGFALAAALEENDTAERSSSTPDLIADTEHLQKLANLDADMDLWCHELVSVSPLPVYWPIQYTHTPSRPTDWLPEETATSGTLPPFEYQSLRLANILVTYWGLRIILSNSIATTCNAIMRAEDYNTHPACSNTEGIRTTAQHLLQKHGGAKTIEYAIHIMRSMPYCLSDSMGLLGAQKSLFALRTALSALRRYPGEDLKWCNAVYQQLDAKKGLRYATEIAKIDIKRKSEEEPLSGKAAVTFLEGVPIDDGKGQRGVMWLQHVGS